MKEARFNREREGRFDAESEKEDVPTKASQRKYFGGGFFL